ncbi:MAG: helix-turn-helix domain-containing protein [bacterium]|nr:helix-turn-helix domain-containing protein [bacterium]
MSQLKKPRELSRLLTLDEVANRLAVSRRTIDRLIAEGELPRSVKIGASSRMPEEDLRLYIERQLRKRGG